MNPQESVEDIVAAIKSEYDIFDVASSIGHEPKRNGGLWKALCPFHVERSPSFTVYREDQEFHCFGCKKWGDVIDLLAFSQNMSNSEFIKKYAEDKKASSPKQKMTIKPKNPPPAQPASDEPEDKWPDWDVDVPVKTYDYHDMFGNLTFQVCRFQRPSDKKDSGYEKTFRQRRPNGSGGWIRSVKGIELVLFHLPQVAASRSVILAEGEKDVETLTSLGFVATTNVAGAKNWNAGYAETFAGKDVTICGDNDPVGQEHVALVFASISKKAKSVRILKIPTEYKDVTEFVEAQKSADIAKSILTEMVDAATPFVKGHRLPIYSFTELEQRYKNHINKIDSTSFDLGKWLPTMRHLRRLVPGDLVVVIAATGAGKTSILANIALKAKPLPCLFFELELPDTSMFERFSGIANNSSSINVENAYKGGDEIGEEALNHFFGHISISTEASVTVEDVESIIVKSELKTGIKPVLVFIDYLQLMKGKGNSRYEKFSNVAEELKVVAKNTQTIIIAASQIQRKGKDDDQKVSMSDAKESGSIENSCGLLIGAWRDHEEPSLMTLRVLKATKGGAGMEIPCTYDLSTLRITERTRQ